MLRIVLNLPVEEVNYLQRFAFEMEAQKRIVKEIIVDNPENPAILESGTFKKYHELYQASATAFDVARDAIQNKFVPKELSRFGTDTFWNLEYSTNQMTIDFKGDLYDNCYDKLEFAVPADCVTITVLDNNTSVNTGCCNCGGN